MVHSLSITAKARTALAWFCYLPGVKIAELFDKNFFGDVQVRCDQIWRSTFEISEIGECMVTVLRTTKLAEKIRALRISILVFIWTVHIQVCSFEQPKWATLQAPKVTFWWARFSGTRVQGLFVVPLVSFLAEVLKEQCGTFSIFCAKIQTGRLKKIWSRFLFCAVSWKQEIWSRVFFWWFWDK